MRWEVLRPILLANPELDWGQPSETRLTRLGVGDLFKPGDEPVDVHRGGGGNMLECRLGQPAVTTEAQAKGPYALRNGPLNPGPALIVALAFD